jgi:hypothetical protein
MNAAKASSSPAVLASGSRWRVPLAADSTTRAATLTTQVASSPQATRVERLRIGRLLVLGVLVLRSAMVRRHRPGTVTEPLSC